MRNNEYYIFPAPLGACCCWIPILGSSSPVCSILCFPKVFAWIAFSNVCGSYRKQKVEVILPTIIHTRVLCSVVFEKSMAALVSYCCGPYVVVEKWESLKARQPDPVEICFWSQGARENHEVWSMWYFVLEVDFEILWWLLCVLLSRLGSFLDKVLHVFNEDIARAGRYVYCATCTFSAFTWPEWPVFYHDNG